MKISNHFLESSQKLSSHLKNQEHYTNVTSSRPTKPQSEWINLMHGDQSLKTLNYKQQKKQLKPCDNTTNDNNKYRYNRKGFLEDDESSDDSIFIVDPGWDDYSLQAIKLNRPILLCPEARRARIAEVNKEIIADQLISEGEGDTHQSISVMVQDTPVEETVFMAIEEIESDDDLEEEDNQFDALKIIDQLRIEKEELGELIIEKKRLEEQKDEEIRKLKAQLQKKEEEAEVQFPKEEFPPLGNTHVARPLLSNYKKFITSETPQQVQKLGKLPINFKKFLLI
ncbi:hypothetical protein Tco_0810186 [Tanacetum coccineum]